MSTLVANISQFITLSSKEKEVIEKAFYPKSLRKGEIWIKEGNICEDVAFIVSGKLRSYYINESGEEVTCFFMQPENFISSFTSFLTNTPTHENIAALEETELKIISKKDLERISELIPQLQIFRRIIAENLFIIMEKRISMLQSQTAYERYENMLKENQDIIMSVPLQYTASFLGISPQHLSRIRKEILK
jgi:CRP-like cAMP-binding protein